MQRRSRSRTSSTHPDSGFVKTLTVQLDGIEKHWILRARLLQAIAGSTTTETTIHDDEQLLDVLASVIDLHFPPGTRFRSPNEE